MLGAVIGAAAAGFVRGLHWLEDLFDEVPGDYLRHALGMLMVGVLIYVLMRWAGHYYVEGVGYAAIQATLTSQLNVAWFLLLLYACKMFATSVSLGSGSSGGIFSPSLFMGATLGGAFAGLASIMFPFLLISMPAFAMVGMGAMVGSSTLGAAMTAGGNDFSGNDARLRHRAADDIGGRGRLWRAAGAVAREHLYREAGAARPTQLQALHANMFLVRRALCDVMDKDFPSVDEDLKELPRLPLAGWRARQLSTRDHLRGRLTPLASLGVNTALRLNSRVASAGDVGNGHAGTAEFHHRAEQYDDVRRHRCGCGAATPSWRS